MTDSHVTTPTTKRGYFHHPEIPLQAPPGPPLIGFPLLRAWPFPEYGATGILQKERHTHGFCLSAVPWLTRRLPPSHEELALDQLRPRRPETRSHGAKPPALADAARPTAQGRAPGPYPPGQRAALEGFCTVPDYVLGQILAGGNFCSMTSRGRRQSHMV